MFYLTSLFVQWSDGTGLTPPAPVPVPAASGGFYGWIWEQGGRRRKRKHPQEPTEQERRTAVLAVERAIADHWDEQLDQLERRIERTLRHEKLYVKTGQQEAFRRYLDQVKTFERAAQEKARARSIAIAQDEADRALAQQQAVERRRRNNNAIAVLLVHLDD